MALIIYKAWKDIKKLSVDPFQERQRCLMAA